MATASVRIRNKDWELTQTAFDMLLLRLDPDPEEAGKKYETLRRKLVMLFGFWGSHFPEDQADEAISRTARKILEGQDIKNLNGYVLEIARLVHKEMVKIEITRRVVLKQRQQDGAVEADQADEERRQRCYTQCLESLPAEDRALIVSYCQGRGAPDRERLAAQLGMPLNSLRVSAFRIRRKLGNCLRNCLGKQPET
jgi:DNA-directed RNA polymerase specialized sigma24 family protein